MVESVVGAEAETAAVAAARAAVGVGAMIAAEIQGDTGGTADGSGIKTKTPERLQRAETSASASQWRAGF
jgi:hypothetical protein